MWKILSKYMLKSYEQTYISTAHRSGYHQIRLKEEFKKYFGCRVKFSTGETKTYESEVLILGLVDAVFAFTKITAPLVRWLRERGWVGIVYIDDFFTRGVNRLQCEQGRQLLLSTLKQAGWLVNTKKSSISSQHCRFLGLEVHSEDQIFRVPREKIDKTIQKIEAIMNCKYVGVWRLASLVGLLLSFVRALGPVVRLQTRSLYKQIDTAPYWSSNIKLKDSAKNELIFWRKNLAAVNGFPFSGGPHFTATEFKDTVCGDASATGLYMCKLSGQMETLLSRPLAEGEIRKSSTWREAKVIEEFYLGEHAEDFQGRHIRHYSDNYGVSRIFSVGSPKPDLQEMALRVYSRCRQLKISLEVEWKRRSEPEMEMADLGSRGPWRVQENFKVDWDTALKIIARNPEVDAFADRTNTLCRRFFSLNYEVEAEARDYFGQSLSKFTKYYLHPHPDHLWNAIKHLFKFGGHAVVLFHVWKKMVTYPFLVQDKHLPVIATKVDWCHPYFLPGEGLEIPAFTGRKKFWSVILEMDFAYFPTMGDAMLPCYQPSHCIEAGCIKCRG